MVKQELTAVQQCPEHVGEGLPGVLLRATRVHVLRQSVEFIRSRAAVTPDARFWHTQLERDERVADHPDAARLVVRGVAEPFHVLASGLVFAGVVLPDLGVFVWTDEVTLDYRMGPEWGRSQLLALLELLRQLVAAASGRVSLGQHVLPHVDAQFVGEWQAYCTGCSAHADPGAVPDRRATTASPDV